MSDLANHNQRVLDLFARRGVNHQATSHFYSLGKVYGRSMFAMPPMGWEGCEPFAVGGYCEEGSFFTGVVWFDDVTGKFSTVQPHA